MSEEKIVPWYDWLMRISGIAIIPTFIYCYNNDGNIYTQTIAAICMVLTVIYSILESREPGSILRFLIPLVVLFACIYCLARSV